MWNEFPCSLASAKDVWPGNMAQIHAEQRHIQGFPKVFQTFSMCVLVLMGRENLINELGWKWEWGSGCWGSLWRGRVLQLQDFVQSTLGQGLTKARLCVLHLITLLSDWLAAVMLGLNQNLLMSCKYWSRLPLRKIQAPSYMFMGNTKIMIWSSFGLRFQNCSLVISLPSAGMLINSLYTLYANRKYLELYIRFTIVSKGMKLHVKLLKKKSLWG